MARLALISDIHGNAVALDAVMTRLADLAVDALVCLGDVFGYYPDGAECLAVLDSHDCTLLMGNHEAMLTGMLGYTEAADAVHRISEDRRRLPAGVTGRLRTLPQTITTEWGGRRVLLAHGSPSEPLTGYVFPDSTLPPLPGDVTALFCGNTHRGFITSRDDSWWVNVGSVGMPRDHGSRAQVVVLSTDPWDVQLVSVALDVDAIRATYPDVHPLVDALLDRGRA